MSEHTALVTVLAEMDRATEPVHRNTLQLWRETLRAAIEAQAAALDVEFTPDAGLTHTHRHHHTTLKPQDAEANTKPHRHKHQAAALDVDVLAMKVRNLPEATYEETAYGSCVPRAAVLAILAGEGGK